MRWLTATTLLIALVAVFGCARESANAWEDVTSLSVEIDTDHVISERFLGFGAEWDSHSYSQAGITDEDFSLIRERVEWMRLPAARVMMQSKWCYTGSGNYDWEFSQMQSLYGILDVCQSLGITVFLTDWGVEPDWLRCPDVDAVDDPDYARIIGTYLDYLVGDRGYTCIKYFVMVNEPNYEVGNWDRWKRGIQNLYAELETRGLTSRVVLMGSDQANADDWHRRAVDQLQAELGAYDIHRYARDTDVRSGKLTDYFAGLWDYARRGDPGAVAKPLVVAEAGMDDGAQYPQGNTNIDTVHYGLFMADYAVQAANAGSAAVLAWMLDDNSLPGFFWGMWKNRANGMQLRPWFYPWSLLCRYVPPGSHIVRAEPSSIDVRVLAARIGESADAWTFCLVNRAATPRVIRLHLEAGPRIQLRRYSYSDDFARKDGDGFPVPVDRATYDLGAGMDVRCEAESVVILSSMD